jgi:type III secretion protein J
MRSWLFVVMCAGCHGTVIAHDQPEREANRIVVVLRRAGVHAHKARAEDGFRVSVPAVQMTAALEVLEHHNLPRPVPRGTGEVFADGEWLPSRSQQRAKEVVGIEGDLDRALWGLPGVRDVRVAVSLRKGDEVSGRPPRSKAAVFVVADASTPDRQDGLRQDILRFVRSKLPAAASEDVFVRVLTAPADPEVPPVPATGPRVWTAVAGAVLGLVSLGGFAWRRRAAA